MSCPNAYIHNINIIIHHLYNVHLFVFLIFFSNCMILRLGSSILHSCDHFFIHQLMSAAVLSAYFSEPPARIMCLRENYTLHQWFCYSMLYIIGNLNAHR